MTNVYTLHCKVSGEEDLFSLDCVGHEDLSDVLEDLARMHVETGLPPSPADCDFWALSNRDGSEFAIAGRVPYGLG